MRQVSSNIKNLLENNLVEPILILDIGDSSSILQQKLTGCPFDLLVDGNLYLSSVDITGIDLPKNSQIINKETYNISFSDPDFYYYNYFNIGLTNTPVILRALFVNTSDEEYIGTNSFTYAPDEIITSLADSVIVYRGLINNAEYITDPSDNSSTLKMSVVSALASLDNKNTIRATKNYIRSVNPTDSSFDSIFDSKQQITLKWGKV
jgi:hypothetical protein